MTSEFARTVIELINNGHCDDDLTLIWTVANARKSRIAIGSSIGAGGPMPGDRVITSDSIRPAYLARRPGTLIRLKQKRWAFKPDDPSVWGRFLNPTDGTTGLLPSQFRKEGT